ncbi:MAG: hypothetical protein R2762_06765 [Bryobacteraceae bacterium]
MKQVLLVGIGVLWAVAGWGAGLSATLQPGKADLKSAGPLAFGPDGILFVGDPMGAQVFALATGDTKAGKAPAVNVDGLHEKIAALLGTSADQILVNDLAVNPASRRVYLSISRGRGPDAAAAIVTVGEDGKLAEMNLANIGHAKVALPNAPGADEKDRRGTPKRLEAITDLQYLDGKLIVAGLSNEEFASNLRSIPFPFRDAGAAASVEIYHGSHGRFETNAPVRTFTSYKIKNQPHLLAAYTCTPLVRIPMTDLKPGNKVKGVTIAELGNRNRPLDMIVYQKNGADFILMNNSSRGVMKMPAANLDGYAPITAPTEKQGVPYETMAQWKGVEQLDRYDNSHALMLVRAEGGALSLTTVALP